jgi:hypothetical protein
VALKGDLSSLALSTVLQILSSEGKTGALEIVSGPKKAVIYLKNGKIIAASSGAKGLRIGHILYQRQLITRDQLQEVLKEAGTARRPVGEVILARGYLGQDTLGEAVREQVREAVLALFFWPEGGFQYRDCPLDFDERVFQEINTMEVVLEAARRMDEWAVLKKAIPSDTMVFRRNEPSGEHQEPVSLDSGEHRLLSHLDGSKSVADIVRETGAGEFTVYQSLYAMASSGLIQQVEQPEAADREPQGESLARLLPIYHDVLVAISRHLEDHVGKAFSEKLFMGCKASLPTEHQVVVAPYQTRLSSAQNVEQVLAVVFKRYQGTAAISPVAGAFNELVSCLLRQEADILGGKQSLHTINRILELLEAMEKYRRGEQRLLVIRGIRGTLSRVAAALGK